ncbi:hypothetical protein [Streptomyces sp. CLCI03]
MAAYGPAEESPLTTLRSRRARPSPTISNWTSLLPVSAVLWTVEKYGSQSTEHG